MTINENEAIANLQTYLRQLSYFDKSITPPPIDGILGEDTEQAIRDFQIRYGIDETGIANKETWEALYREYLKSVKENALPQKISLFPVIEKDYTIERNDNWFLVEALQYMLEELRYSYDNFEGVKRSGVYDEETENAVKDFQKRNLLEESGKVNKETWDAITRQFNENSLNFKE